MISLILVVCLAAAPDTCRDVDPMVQMTPVACQTMGQMAALAWLDEHPKWRLRGWRCGPAAVEQPT